MMCDNDYLSCRENNENRQGHAVKRPNWGEVFTNCLGKIPKLCCDALTNGAELAWSACESEHRCKEMNLKYTGDWKTGSTMSLSLDFETAPGQHHNAVVARSSPSPLPTIFKPGVLLIRADWCPPPLPSRRKKSQCSCIQGSWYCRKLHDQHRNRCFLDFCSRPRATWVVS